VLILTSAGFSGEVEISAGMGLSSRTRRRFSARHDVAIAALRVGYKAAGEEQRGGQGGRHRALSAQKNRLLTSDERACASEAEIAAENQRQIAGGPISAKAVFDGQSPVAAGRVASRSMRAPEKRNGNRESGQQFAVARVTRRPRAPKGGGLKRPPGRRRCRFRRRRDAVAVPIAALPPPPTDSLPPLRDK